MRRRDGGLSDPAVTLRLERVLGTAVRDCRGIGGQHGVRHYRVTLADGRTAFAKLAGAAADSEAAGFAAAGFAAAGFAAAGFAAEARGLRWLGEAGAVPVPEEAPARQATERFGRDLARLHAAGAAGF